MAQYYNLITNANGIITIVNIPPLCYPTDNFQLIQVQNVNNRGNDLTYAALPQDAEKTIYQPQTINLGGQVATAQLDSRQNDFLINTNEAALSESIIKTESQEVQSVDQNDGQKLQWINEQDDSVDSKSILKENVLTPVQVDPSIKNQQQKSTVISPSSAQYTHSESMIHDSMEKREGKLDKRQQNSSGLKRLSETSSVGNSFSTFNQNSTISSTHFQDSIQTGKAGGMAETKSLVGRNAVPIQTEMKDLRERIRDANKLRHRSSQKIKQQQQQHGSKPKFQLVRPQSKNSSYANIAARQPRINVNPRPSSISRASKQQQQQVAQPRQQTPLLNTVQKHVSTPQQKQQQQQQLWTPVKNEYVSCPVLDETEAIEDNQVLEQQTSFPSVDSDATMESYAIFKENITNPKTAVVQKQVEGSRARILARLVNGEQRLITFDIPVKDCTVSDLLELVGITFGQQTTVSLVSDSSTIGINYIVDTEIETMTSVEKIDAVLQDSKQSRSTRQVVGSQDDDSESLGILKQEKPENVSGQLASCQKCGVPVTPCCDTCRGKLPENAKRIPVASTNTSEKEDIPVSIDESRKDKIQQVPKTRKPKRRKLKRPINREPECSAIPSDKKEHGGKSRKLDEFE